LDDITVKVKRCKLSIDLRDKVAINLNYQRLNNKPSINGISLVGNKTSKELNLLSSRPIDYSTVNLESANKSDYLVILGNDSINKKLKIKEISSHLIRTVNEVPNNMELGSYIFLSMEDK